VGNEAADELHGECRLTHPTKDSREQVEPTKPHGLMGQVRMLRGQAISANETVNERVASRKENKSSVPVCQRVAAIT